MRSDPLKAFRKCCSYGFHEGAIIVVLIQLNLAAFCLAPPWYQFVAHEAVDVSAEHMLHIPSTYVDDVAIAQDKLLETYHNGVTIWNMDTILPGMLLGVSTSFLAAALATAKYPQWRQFALISSTIVTIIQAVYVTGLALTYVPYMAEDSTDMVAVIEHPHATTALEAKSGLLLNLVSQLLHVAALALFQYHRTRNEARNKKLGIQTEQWTKCHVTRAHRRAVDVTDALCSLAILGDVLAFWYSWNIQGSTRSRQLWEATATRADVAMLACPLVTLFGIHLAFHPLQSLPYLVSVALHIWTLFDVPIGVGTRHWGPVATLSSALLLFGSSLMLLMIGGSPPVRVVSPCRVDTGDESLAVSEVRFRDTGRAVEGWVDHGSKARNMPTVIGSPIH